MQINQRNITRKKTSRFTSTPESPILFNNAGPKERLKVVVPNPQFFDKDERLNKTCPKCGSDQVSYLVYSIFYDDGDEKLVESGEIILMGCMFHEPYNLGCRDCEHMWASVPMCLTDEK